MIAAVASQDKAITTLPLLLNAYTLLGHKQFLVKKLHRDINIIAITGNQEGELAKLSDVVLCTGNPTEICPLGLTPTTSTTAMTVVGDILVVLLMEQIGFTKKEYAKRHHSGYLGTKARNE